MTDRNDNLTDVTMSSMRERIIELEQLITVHRFELCHQVGEVVHGIEKMSNQVTTLDARVADVHQSVQEEFNRSISAFGTQLSEFENMFEMRVIAFDAQLSGHHEVRSDRILPYS